MNTLLHKLEGPIKLTKQLGSDTKKKIPQGKLKDFDVCVGLSPFKFLLDMPRSVLWVNGACFRRFGCRTVSLPLSPNLNLPLSVRLAE